MNNLKIKTQNFKIGKKLQQAFHKRKYLNGQQAYERVISDIIHQGNANWNHHEKPPYTGTRMTKPKKTNGTKCW